jgi:hypothetical protein
LVLPAIVHEQTDEAHIPTSASGLDLIRFPCGVARAEQDNAFCGLSDGGTDNKSASGKKSSNKSSSKSSFGKNKVICAYILDLN